ncbi:MAG: Ig-like domain-containing protein [Gemmatimonadetes bacterium]|nr:Ig-like domain-containing protein [Gemmatimonadota bacterium]
MPLFNRNKALVALSLGALAALGACGDDVTVPVAPAAPVVLTISPPSANMNIGESLNFAVQISGGSATAAPTLASCTSSNAAVATAAVQGSACRVTAVAAGNATVTAAASTGQSAAAAVSVAAPAAAISGLAVSPSAASVPVGQSVTIVPTVNRANSGVAVAYTYATSAATVATVSTAGVVTAVAPGIATITVTAAGTGTGTTATTLTTAATITVTALPTGITALTVSPANIALATGGTSQIAASVQQPTGAAAATISYTSSNTSVATVSATGVVTGAAQGSAVITVTATSAANASFGAATLSQAVAVTVAPPAQVSILSMTDNGATIDITNVQGQFEVNTIVNANGQNVTAVNAWVCEAGETVTQCATRSGTPAASQSFSAQGSGATQVQLYINSAAFAAPNFTTGDNAAVTYTNGLKTIVATLTTAPAGTATASNAVNAVNFNNQDGWTVQWTLPNRAQDAAGVTWYGGPDTASTAIAGATSGTGRFALVPVIYTAGRDVRYATIDIASQGGLACGAAMIDSVRPFGGTYGAITRSTANYAFNCGGTASTNNATGYAPRVVGAVDNTNAGSYPGVDPTAVAGAAVGTTIFTRAGGNLAANRYYTTPLYNVSGQLVPGDYVAPAVARFDIRGSNTTGGSAADSGWVTGTYALDQRTALGAQLRYQVADANVGLPVTRNTVFNVCARPATISTTAPTTCTTPLATGGLSSTIASLALGESATDFTNRAYFAVATETDRLGNRATTNPYTYTPTGLAQVLATAGQTAATGVNAAPSYQEFGVDLTAPVVVAIPNTGTGATAGFARTDVDSIYSTLANTAAGANANTAVFGARFTDARSGFFTCVATNCSAAGAGNGAGVVRGGDFQIVRRALPAVPVVTNAITPTNLVAATTSAALLVNNSINAAAGTNSGDPSIREFYINIFGDAARNTIAAPPTINANQAGYYTFTGTLADRAGNTTALTQRSVAIDNAAPVVSGITPPATFTGGSTTTTILVSGTDDLEVLAGELSIRYPSLGAANSIRFRRVAASTATFRAGIWHNPFQSLSDNLLASPIGAGTTLGGAGITIPVPFIQQVAVTDGADAPPTQAALFATIGGAADPRPNQIGVTTFDMRNSTTVAGFAATSRSAEVTTAIAGTQVATPTAATSTKDWGATGAGITTWAAFNAAAATGGAIEFRVTTPTSITNPPFSVVHIVRENGAEADYLGQAGFVGQLDQGGNRFWRYSITSAASTQGAGVTVAALANGDQVRAIGVDASGNGLASRTVTFGLANALPGGTTVVAAGVAAAAPFTTLANAGAAINVNLGASANPNGAALVASCSSSSNLVTVSIGAGNVCTINPAGVVLANTDVTITFSVTGSVAGFNTNTITATRTITRTP